MRSKRYFVALFWALFVLGLAATIATLMHGHTIALFETKGLIAMKERDLLIKATALIATILIPVFAMTFFFAWRYREGNENAKYSPEWAHGKYDELIWWAVPAEIVLVLAVITSQSTHDLDPYRPLDINVKAKPLKVQVVSLDWKWLFIYPQEHIATVNFLELPKDTPVEFDITAESPMNSFWIPELAGQVYAMPGMKTQLHLIGNEVGDFTGRGSNFTGAGFSDMTFTTRVAEPKDFENWVNKTESSDDVLDHHDYSELTLPGTSTVRLYGDVSEDIFDSILTKTMREDHVNRPMEMENMQNDHL